MPTTMVIAPSCNPFEHGLSFLPRHTSSQENRLHAQDLKAPVDREILLLREDLGGRQEGNLVAAVKGNACGSNRAGCLAASNISLKQAVHGLALLHI